MPKYSCNRFYDRLFRRKYFADDDLEKTDLSRCLGLVDLTALGIGSTLGAGAYVLAGQVAKRDAGPAVVVSFLVAAVASMLAGLCYAEFGARVPRAGSAYVYIYVTVAEIAAFVIGWDLILEYVIGAASVARTASGYFDNLIGNKLVSWFSQNLQIQSGVFAPYADLLALGIIMVLTAILAFGVKESAFVNKIFTGLNLSILGYIIIMGCFKDEPSNWKIPESQIPKHLDCGHKDNITGCGVGGFAPYGFNGIIKGAATCFYAFIGFDVIATTGEEAKNPQRNIPLATVISLSLIFCVYFGISVTITMMAPYYLLDMDAPFAVIFKNADWEISRYIISIGALFALTTSLLGAMFPMPRVVLAMARDGLVFRFFARVEKRVKTPVIATLVAGTFAAAMATIFNIDALVEMMSIGTLLAYTLVGACVLLLRYEPHESEKVFIEGRPSTSYLHFVTPITLIKNSNAILSPDKIPSYFSAILVKWMTLFLLLCLIGIGLLLNFAASNLFETADWWAILVFVILIVLVITVLIIIWRQPQSSAKLNFKVPGLPFFPALSMFINIYLMINLDLFTWIRFTVWMGIGMIVYFAYGVWHSSEGTRNQFGTRDGAIEVDIQVQNYPSQVTLIKNTQKEFDVPSVQPSAPMFENRNGQYVQKFGSDQIDHNASYHL